MADWLEAHGVTLVVLAGYMHLLTPAFLDRFPGAVVNVHPSLLPSFPGGHPVEDQLAAGVTESGATVHLVDEGVDSGPILAQERVPVLPGDTAESLHERIQAVEHRLLPEIVRETVRALISVVRQDRRRRVRARARTSSAGELVASGGTAAYLEDELGLEVERVETLTGSPEMLGGRVKTLHPRDPRGDPRAPRPRRGRRRRSQQHGIEPFDLVCVNLYPFERVSAQRGVTEAEAVEMIDIGGPSMLRGAAKNFAHVAPVCRPERVRRRARRASRGRRAVARDAAASSRPRRSRRRPPTTPRSPRWFAEREPFPEHARRSPLEKVLDLAYGENPHQRAAFYAERGARSHLLARVEQLHGQGALVQQPQRPRRGARCSRASSRCRPA